MNKEKRNLIPDYPGYEMDEHGYDVNLIRAMLLADSKEVADKHGYDVNLVRAMLEASRKVVTGGRKV